MQRAIVILLSTLVITAVSLLGKRFPSLAGVIATMPLIIPLSIWAAYQSSGRDYQAIQKLVSAMLWGIALTGSFVVYARIGVGRGWPIWLVILSSYLGWLLGYAILRALSIL